MFFIPYLFAFMVPRLFVTSFNIINCMSSLGLEEDKCMSVAF